MAVGAAYAKRVRVTTSVAAATNADDIGGLTSADFERLRAELETTSFPDAGVETYIAGVKGISVSLSGNYDSANAPQARLFTAEGDGSSVWIHYLPNGSAGWKVECKVFSVKLGGGVKDLETFSCTLKATGAIATV